jgi:hypothetical protein
MSDTFGASDLNADMPGLGPQPGNVRGPPVQLPSALQGLVKHFTQQSGGQTPEPGAPSGPGGQQKKPKLGSTDPPMRDARSIAPLPANAPQPPPSFTPTLPSIPRDHTQWGQPEAFPRLPQTFELPGMYHSLGGYFAQHGAFASAPLGIGMAAYSAAYQKAFREGQDWKMKQSLEQIKLHSAQLEDIEQARSIEYADAFTRHQVEGDKDPQALRDDIERVAVEHGDKDVLAMLENGDSAETIRRFLAKHEANIRDLKKANTKQDEQDAQDAQYGLAPARSEASGAYDPYAPDAPARPAGVGPHPDKTAEPDTPGDQRNENQKLIDAGAWDMVEGYKPTGAEYGKMTSTAMAKRKLEMEQKLKEIAADPNLNKDGQHPEEVLNAVKREVPEAATTLDNYSQYREGPGVGGRAGSGGPEAAMWGLMTPLATKMFPGEKGTGVGAFSGSNFTKRLAFADNTQYQTTLRRVATTAEGGAQVIAAANALPPEASDPNAFKRAMKQAMDENTGDERYVALANAVKRYQSEMNVVIRGGVGGQGETMENLRTVNPIFATPTNYRLIVAQDAQLAQASVNSFKHQYKQMGGGPMPGLDPDAESQLHDLANMDPVHQVQPGQVVPGKEWSDGKARVWLGPFDERGRLRQNPDDNWDMAK